jgi:hypothetical protein
MDTNAYVMAIDEALSSSLKDGQPYAVVSFDGAFWILPRAEALDIFPEEIIYSTDEAL